MSALHYLMKPVKKEKFFGVLDKAVAHIKKEGSILLAQTIDGTVRILQRDILYIEATAHYVIVQTKNDRFEIKTSIGEVQNLLEMILAVISPVLSIYIPKLTIDLVTSSASIEKILITLGGAGIVKKQTDMVENILKIATDYIGGYF